MEITFSGVVNSEFNHCRLHSIQIELQYKIGGKIKSEVLK